MTHEVTGTLLDYDRHTSSKSGRKKLNFWGTVLAVLELLDSNQHNTGTPLNACGKNSFYHLFPLSLTFKKATQTGVTKMSVLPGMACSLTYSLTLKTVIL